MKTLHRTILCAGVAALQVALLGFMAGQREIIVRTGDVVYLRTAPVDPRDIFRGDYVRLSYEISSIDAALFGGSEAAASLHRGQVFYAALKEAPGGRSVIESAGTGKPDADVFIKGRVRYAGAQTVTAKYGIEAFFTQQGEALRIEKDRFREGTQVSLEIEVALGGGGTPVIRSLRWAPLGIGIELVQDEPTRQDRNRRRQTPAREAVVKLLNASDREVAVLDMPGGKGAFDLVPLPDWRGEAVTWEPAAPAPTPAPEHIALLKPGESRSMRVVFSDPHWTLRRPDGETTSVPDVPNVRFRLVYRPPTAAAADLPHADALYVSELPSQAFWGQGRVD